MSVNLEPTRANPKGFEEIPEIKELFEGEPVLKGWPGYNQSPTVVETSAPLDPLSLEYQKIHTALQEAFQLKNLPEYINQLYSLLGKIRDEINATRSALHGDIDLTHHAWRDNAAYPTSPEIRKTIQTNSDYKWWTNTVNNQRAVHCWRQQQYRKTGFSDLTDETSLHNSQMCAESLAEFLEKRGGGFIRAAVVEGRPSTNDVGTSIPYSPFQVETIYKGFN